MKPDIQTKTSRISILVLHLISGYMGQDDQVGETGEVRVAVS